jgi:hypothetical protein
MREGYEVAALKNRFCYFTTYPPINTRYTETEEGPSAGMVLEIEVKHKLEPQT